MLPRPRLTRRVVDDDDTNSQLFACTQITSVFSFRPACRRISLYVSHNDDVCWALLREMWNVAESEAPARVDSQWLNYFAVFHDESTSQVSLLLLLLLFCVLRSGTVELGIKCWQVFTSRTRERGEIGDTSWTSSSLIMSNDDVKLWHTESSQIIWGVAGDDPFVSYGIMDVIPETSWNARHPHPDMLWTFWQKISLFNLIVIISALKYYKSGESRSWDAAR